MLKKPVFSNFSEYWYYAKYLSRAQRKIIYKSLPSEQKKSLDDSYLLDGWNDLFYRNEINERLDGLKEAYGYDILELRAKILKGKSVYVPTKFWHVVREQMEQYKPEQVSFVMYGLYSIQCEQNKNVSLIVYDPYHNDSE